VKWPDPIDAGVVHHHIERPVPVLTDVEEPAERVFVGHVELNTQRAVPQ
jgi:hypothetical protein